MAAASTRHSIPGIISLGILMLGILMPVCLCLGGCVSSSSTAPDPSAPRPPELRIEKHELKATPELDPMTFTPLEGTQAEILSRHPDQRAPGPRSPCDPCEVSVGDASLVAAMTVTETEHGGQQVVVDVSRDGDRIYATSLGDPCVVPPLWGLWTYDDHWTLEVVRVEARQQGRAVTCDPVGDVIQDGESLNGRRGYQESFGFQLMGGKPFYFFKRRGEWAVWYDGDEIPLGYSRISHYACCSGAAANLRSSDSMVAFFAERDGTRYYVEIGCRRVGARLPSKEVTDG
jgi:hypothetical protein